ncbi:MAG: FecR domain-containing protein, partial [Pseudomonas sp.]
MSTQPLPMTDDDRFAEASAWHFRLQAEDVTAAEHDAFAAWLASEPGNAGAYSEAQALMAALQGPARALHAQHAKPRRRSLPWAAAAVLVLALGIAWQSPWWDRLRADYYTGVGETQTLTLADGSQVELDTDAALSIEFTAGERRVHLLRGGAWFDVTHDAELPFVVTSDDARVQVLGTQFSVTQLAGSTQVRLAHGRVAASVGSQSVTLAPGQQVAIGSTGLSAVSAFDPAAAFAWRQRQLVFRQQPLGEVVAELNRYRSGRLVLLDDELQRKTVSG